MNTYTLNQELNGIEIKFDQKPAAEVLTELKAAGYRWHKVKKLWYAKQTAERISIAARLTGTEAAQPIKAEPGKINLENLGETRKDGKLTDIIRQELKARNVKGVTVKSTYAGYTKSITLTIKADENDFASIEEMKKRYPFYAFSADLEYRNLYAYIDGEQVTPSAWITMTEDKKEDVYTDYLKRAAFRLDTLNEYKLREENRDYYYELTSAFFEKCRAAFLIANQWNYNNSDPYTDYHDVGYYLHIKLKKPSNIQPRQEMTEAERTAYIEEIERKEAERAAAIAKMEQEQEEARKRHEAYEAQRKIDREQIYNNITIEDIPESDQFYITNLIGGTGKECNLEELRETEARHTSKYEALISRKVIFSDNATFELFGKYLIDDFDFLEGKGGIASEDVRLENLPNLYGLTAEQRENIKFYMTNCVAIYAGDTLKLISDPEGFSYSRYTYEPTQESEIRSAKTELEAQRKESEQKMPLEALKEPEKPFSFFA